MTATLATQPHVARDHHERLLRHVNRMPATADLIDNGDVAQLRVALDETCEFLTELLVPHMEAAERALYPELERMLQNRHSMTPMRREHDEIRAAVGLLVSLRDALAGSHVAPRDAIRLRRALFRLYGLLRVHLAEELLYSDIVEHGATPEQENALAAAMEHAGTARF